MSFLIIPKEKRKPLIEKWNYYLDRISLEMKDQHGYNIFRTKYNKTILGYQPNGMKN